MKAPQLFNIVRGRRRPAPGAAPGTLIVNPDAEQSEIHVVRYGPEAVDERQVTTIDEVKSLLGQHKVTWINVDGLGDIDLIRQIGELFDMHRLAIADVVNITQRPKTEDYGEALFVISRMPHMLDEGLWIEQVSSFLRGGVLVTFQEKGGDCWGPVRERIRQNRGLIRQEGADYLLYALLDSVTDSYFPILEHFGDAVEDLNDRIMEQPDPSEIRDMHSIRQDLITLRRAIWPLRDMFSALMREQRRFLGDTAAIYLRDCYDHAVQLLDLVETYREIAAISMELYVTATSNRLNEIMKVLTIISTIFIPLSFIASVYGMNFNAEKSPFNMPELDWQYGYPFVLGLMALIGFALLFWFWRRGWIGFK
jgi:magnesium transporter